MSDLSLIILTGQSGSGKSTAMRVLEDQGFYCVDNLPTRLVEELVRTVRDEVGVKRLAVVMDARNPRSLSEAPALVEKLRAHAEVRVVYFEAKEEALLRRYSETRRRHPLDGGAGLDHEHDAARLFEGSDHFLDGMRPDHGRAGGLPGEEVVHFRDGPIVGHDGEAVVVHVENEILAHDGQSDQSDVAPWFHFLFRLKARLR